MSMTLVNLERQPGTSKEECRAFLQCLYSHVEHGPQRDEATDAERQPGVSDGLQPVWVSGVETVAAGRAAIERAARACDKNWQRLYRFPE
jgi:hypothetical protein